MTVSAAPLPTYYIPHGGGPCFFMDWPGPMAGAWDSLAAWLRGLEQALPGRPRAIVVISAHWEAPTPTTTSRVDPPLIFDYSGFPAHTYELTYPAPGSPALAARIGELLAGAGIASATDERRGFDHGVFVPFLLVEPQADVPIVQLSLAAGLDPATHLAIGRALAPLRAEGVLIAGTGMSYHNLGAFGRSGSLPGAEAFDGWLAETVLTADPEQRDARLIGWERAPGARLAHSREDHLLPLMVVTGAAGGDLGTLPFHEHVLGMPLAAVRFG